MTPTLPALRWPSLPRGDGRRSLGTLVLALVASLLLHAAWSLWPADEPAREDAPPLTATLLQMPAPPTATPVEPGPRIRAARRVSSAHVTAEPAAAAGESPQAVAAPAPASAPVAAAPVAAPVAPPVDSPAPSAPAAPPPANVLPPRLDLAYKVYMGTQGFHIGDATYRFEHDGGRYRIATVAQARGLAALIVQGRGRLESHGTITAAGLVPESFELERGRPDKREAARFDWAAGTLTLHDGKTVPLDASTYDPLTVLWQSYFTPPQSDVYTLNVATTRRVAHYTVTREGDERIPGLQGDIDTVRWHRVSEDRRTEAWFWLAPSLHYIPVKIRVTQTSRGTLEVLLDAIRTDAPPGDDPGSDLPPLPPSVHPADPFAEHGQ